MIHHEKTLVIEPNIAVWYFRASCSCCGWTSSWLHKRATVERQAAKHAESHMERVA